MRYNAGYNREGEYDHFVVSEPMPLLEWLFANVPQSKSKIKATLQGRGIKVNGKTVSQFDYPLEKGGQELFDIIVAELESITNSDSKEQLLDFAGDDANYGRADKVAAKLLLARLYLNAKVYTGTAQWQKAVDYATEVIKSNYKLNETALGDYFFAPIKLDRHEVYPVPDYGSGVSPFYIVLSMWVGALITCVLMPPKSSEGTPYSPFEMYAGNLLLYVTLSILQAFVTITGAHILGVHIDNYPLFILSATLVSVVFMTLIYSIVSAIGTVGEGIVVILLVFQISGTGGIYPIEIMPTLFQELYNYLPMTYAIKLVREAQLGVIWSNYTPALIMLLAIGIVTIIVSVIIKEKADKPSKYFEEKLKESGLF